MKTDPGVIDELKQVLDEKLQSFGFLKDPQPDFYAGKVYERWIRDAGWRIDSLRIIHRNKNVRSFELDISVFLKIDGKEIPFDGVGVNYLVSGKGEDYYLPTLFASLRIRGFINKVINDVEKSLSWLNLYNTGHKCIVEMETERGVHAAKGSKHYKKMLEFLRKVRQNEETSEPSFPDITTNDEVIERWIKGFDSERHKKMEEILSQKSDRPIKIDINEVLKNRP